MKASSIWEISKRFDLLLGRLNYHSSYSNYLRSIKPEIVEVIFQLISKNKLSGFKINNLSPFRKIRQALFRSIRELFRGIMKSEGNSTKLDVELLFIIESENHFKQYAALYDHLSISNHKHVVLFLNTEVYSKHKEDVEEAILLNSLYNRGDYIRSFCRLWGTNVRILSERVWNRMTNWRGWQLKVELIYLNSKILTEKYLLESSALRLINHHLKVAVFCKAEGYKIRSLIEIFNNNNIHTVAIQHGFIKKDIKYNKLKINEYLVWSKLFGRELDYSEAECCTVPLGCPSYDKHFQIRSIEKKIGSVKKLIFLPNSGKSQTPVDEIVFALNICLRYVKEHSDYELTIKPHPGGDLGLIQKLIVENELPQIKLLDKYDLIDFNKYDIIVTMNSTIGIESAIFRKPIIVMLSSLEMLMVDDYINYGIGEFVTSYAGMSRAVDKILSNYEEYQEHCERFIEDYLANPGTAGRATVDYISNYMTANV